MAALAVRFSRILRRPPLTAHEVFPHCHRLEVSRIHAGSITAEMIDREAALDRPDDILIGESVRQSVDARRWFELAVSRLVATAQPIPASVISRLCDLSPEPNRRRRMRIHTFWHSRNLIDSPAEDRVAISKVSAPSPSSSVAAESLQWRRARRPRPSRSRSAARRLGGVQRVQLVA